MQVFFVSIRTAKIFGPGEVLEVRSSAGEQMYLRLSWPYAEMFEEWEGYAVVVPERNEVWGAGHPRVEEGEVAFEFPFTPQAIPPQELKLFTQIVQGTSEQDATSEPTDEAEVAEED